MNPETLATAHVVLRVGELNYGSIMATSYGSDGGWGEYMRASLAASGIAPLGLGKVRIVAAWPDCWDDLAVFLHEHSHHGVNAAPDARRIAKAWAKLALRIKSELTKLGNHPAYRGKAVLAVDRTVFWAWQAEGRKGYRPTLRGAMNQGSRSWTHGLLVPKVTIIAKRTVTHWEFVTTDQTATTPPESTPSSPEE